MYKLMIVALKKLSSFWSSATIKLPLEIRVGSNYRGLHHKQSQAPHFIALFMLMFIDLFMLVLSSRKLTSQLLYLHALVG